MRVTLHIWTHSTTNAPPLSKLFLNINKINFQERIISCSMDFSLDLGFTIVPHDPNSPLNYSSLIFPSEIRTFLPQSNGAVHRKIFQYIQQGKIISYMYKHLPFCLQDERIESLWMKETCNESLDANHGKPAINHQKTNKIQNICNLQIKQQT